MSKRDVVQGADSCELPQPNERAVLTVLVVGTVLAPLDSSIVNIALPAIGAHYGETMAAVGWVATAYLLTTATLLLSMGRLGDVWGLRRLYVAGLLIFGAGSLACALSGSIETLVASRVFQAVGAAMIFAAGPALVARTFPPNRRGWALGYVSLAVSVGLTLGPSLGGLLVGTFGWPSIFLINVPLTVAVAAMAWRLLPDECPRGESFDLFGAVLGGGALLLLLLGLSSAETGSVIAPAVIAPIAAAAVFFGTFLWWERRASAPMVDLRLFESRAFSAGLAAATVAYLALFSATFTLPFYLLRVLGLDARVAGLVLTVTPLAMAALAPVAGRASDRRGSRGLATGGMVTLAVGLLAASFLGTASTVWAVGAVLVIIGSGMAVFQTPNTAAILRATPRHNAGVGSAFVAEARNVGMALGIALTAAILGAHLGAGGLPEGSGQLPTATAALLSEGMSVALKVGAALAACGAVLSWFGRDSGAVEQVAGTL